MSEKYTPEPWEVMQTCEDENDIIGSDCNLTDMVLASNVWDANAKRIVACVNACAGVPTEVIEAGFVRQLCESWRSAYEHSGTPQNDFEKAVLVASGKVK